MPRQYVIKRLLQEQSGSYLVILPKLWVQALGLKQGDEMTLIFNGIIKIIPKKPEREKP